MTRNCSIAISPCPNDVYIFAGLILGKVSSADVSLEFEFKDIQQLNGLALDFKKDIVKVSAAALPSLLGDYDVMPAGGAMGMGVGPLLLTNDCEFDVSNEIMLPGENTTANFLLDRFFNWPAKKTFLPFDELYQTLCTKKGSQGVVIHENRFTYLDDGLTLGADLGRMWSDETELPLPLGVIVSRAELGLKKELTALIQQSITWAKNNSQVVLNLCRNYSQSMQDNIMLSHIDIYVNSFSYDMEDEGRRAIKTLLNFRGESEKRE